MNWVFSSIYGSMYHMDYRKKTLMVNVFFASEPDETRTDTIISF